MCTVDRVAAAAAAALCRRGMIDVKRLKPNVAVGNSVCSLTTINCVARGNEAVVRGNEAMRTVTKTPQYRRQDVSSPVFVIRNSRSVFASARYTPDATINCKCLPVGDDDDDET